MKTVHRKYRDDIWQSELRCATGRSAIRYMLDRVNIMGVTLPCYVPEGVIDPIIDARKRFQFYKLNTDLTPDLNSLEEILVANPGRNLIVVIDYFGFESPMKEIGALADKHGATVFEDCAHALWAKAEHADVALWSLNKVLPVTDGAIMRAKMPWLLDADNLGEPNYAALADYLAHLKGGDTYDRYYAGVWRDFTLRRQSSTSRLIEGNDDLMTAERVTRQMNVRAYSAVVPEEFKLHDYQAPAFAYPIVCRRGPREAVVQALRKIDISPAALVEKWDHIPNDPRYAIERAFCGNHLLLPVGTDVSGFDVSAACLVLKQCLAREAA